MIDMKKSLIASLVVSATFFVGCATTSSDSLTEAQKAELGDWYTTASLVATAREWNDSDNLIFYNGGYEDQIGFLNDLVKRNREAIALTNKTSLEVAKIYVANQLWDKVQANPNIDRDLAIYEATMVLEVQDLSSTAQKILRIRKGESHITSRTASHSDWKQALEESTSKNEFVTRVCVTMQSLDDYLYILEKNVNEMSEISHAFSKLAGSSEFQDMLSGLTKESIGITSRARAARKALAEITDYTTSIPREIALATKSAKTLMELIKLLK